MSIEEPIIETFGTGGLVKAAGIFIIGVIILSGFATGIDNSNPKSATLTMTENPHDGDIITLGAHTFEFDSGDGVSAGNIPVSIGATLFDTSNNFESAVTANTDFDVQ